MSPLLQKTTTTEQPQEHPQAQEECEVFLEDNERKLPKLLKEHIQWVANRSGHQFEKCFMPNEKPPTMKAALDEFRIKFRTMKLLEENATKMQQKLLEQEENKTKNNGEGLEEATTDDTTSSITKTKTNDIITSTSSTVDILKHFMNQRGSQQQQSKPKTSTTNNTITTTMPPVVADNNNNQFLRVEKLMEILNSSSSEEEEDMSREDVELIQKAIQGFSPNSMNGGGPLENWLVDSFLCSAEEIIPNLWLGGYVTAHNKTKLLDEMKIERVVCVGGKYLNFGLSDKYQPPFISSDIQYHIIDVDDTSKEYDCQTLRNSFDNAVKFIDDGLSENEPTFVHCMGGSSRSVSIICAYLIYKYNIKLDDALRLVRSARPIATPNNGFIQQLNDWYDTTK